METLEQTNYQNCDYRSIWVLGTIEVPTIGKAYLLIFVEDMRECTQVPDEDRFWTALFLVAPMYSGPQAIQSGLDLIGWDKSRTPTDTDEAVALAEDGTRIVLWETQVEEGKEQEAYNEAQKFFANPELVLPKLKGTKFGKTGYQWLQ